VPVGVRIPKLLVAEPAGFSAEALDLLARHARVDCRDLDREGLLRAVGDAEILWVRLRTRIDREVFEAAPRLRVLVTNTTGLAHVDLGEAARRGVLVLSLRGEKEFLKSIRATAELTVGLALALLRGIPSAARHVRSGGWNRDLFRGRELFEKTVGVVGYGRLGEIVGHYLLAFGATVLAADPNRDAASVEPGVGLVPLDELLRRSEVVTLHVNLDSGTARFFGRRELALMRPGAVLVNTARGELVDEEALLEALESNRLAGAALDVLADERSGGMGEHPLVRLSRTHPGVLVTPHIGGNTVESGPRTELFLARKLAALLEGGR